jgi:MYXO-CTERM domain-containing protein
LAWLCPVGVPAARKRRSREKAGGREPADEKSREEIRMSRCTLVCGVLVASAAGVTGTAHAVPIYVENNSFEATVLEDCTWLPGAPEGWTLIEGNFGTLNPSDYVYPDGVPDGVNVAYSNGGTIGQVLSVVLEPNKLYSLQVLLGDRPTMPFPGYRAQLLAGGELLAEDVDTISPESPEFESTLVRFHTDFADPRLGQALEIRLVSFGRQVLFDKVSLHSTPIPAPGALALLAVAGLATRRRRR